MSKHTKEPWVLIGEDRSVDGCHMNLYCGHIYPSAPEKYIGDICYFQSADHIDGISRTEAAANAARIVACVNALTGIDDPATFIAEVTETLSALSEHLDRHSDVVDGEDGQPEANREMRLKSDVDALLAKLEDTPS